MLDINNQTITLENTSLNELGSENIKGVAGNYDDAVNDQAVKYYHYNWNYGNDSMIDNFDVNAGVINLSAFSKNFNDLDINNNDEGDAVVDLAFDNQSITLVGVNADELSQDNFYGV